MYRSIKKRGNKNTIQQKKKDNKDKQNKTLEYN
jgi:hypothetical protein